MLEKLDRNGVKVVLLVANRTSQLKEIQIWFRKALNRFILLRSTTTPQPGTTLSSSCNYMVILDLMLTGNVSAVETTWVFKVPKNDTNLRNCDGTPLFFKLLVNIFPDSDISTHLSTISCQWKGTFIKSLKLEVIRFSWNSLATIFGEMIEKLIFNLHALFKVGHIMEVFLKQPFYRYGMWFFFIILFLFLVLELQEKGLLFIYVFIWMTDVSYGQGWDWVKG